MKVNFNVYFKDFDGSVLLIDKKPQCMGVIVSQCLFNGTGSVSYTHLTLPTIPDV